MKPTPANTLSPGALRQKITIQQRSTTQDAAGEQLPVWSTFATRRAELIRLPGKEVFASETRNGRVPATWRLRWLEGVLPKMRVVDQENRVYDIISASDPTGRREELLITSQELVEETIS